MTIELSLPKVSAAPDPAVETRLVYVEEAVESLAYANPPLLLEQTVEAVSLFNSQSLKPALRIALLDLYLKPYAYALNVRRTQESAQTSTALNRQRALSRQLRRSAIELAWGYKQALSEVSTRKNRFSSGKEYRTCLQRALLCSSQAALHCYDEYRPTEPRLWLEIIALFKFAEKEGQAQERVPMPIDDPIFSQSVAECFKRFCLTSLVDPYHLAYGELWIVHEAFGEYANVVQILDVSETKHSAGKFVIDPAVDTKPTALVQHESPPAANCRLLDANPVLAPLHKRLHRGEQNDALSSHVLAAMIRALGLPPKRHTPREQIKDKINVAAGLSTVHYFIRGGHMSARPQTSHDDGIEINDVSSRPEGQNVSYRHEPWRVVDEGPSGVRIVREIQPRNPVGVGDLIGIQFPLRGDGERDWNIAVVRWLGIDGEQSYQVGVQTLGEVATPVTAFADKMTEAITRIPRPTLALPAVGNEPGNTLITPHGLFERGEILRVQAENHSWLVEALALSESTSTFDRFTYRII